MPRTVYGVLGEDKSDKETIEAILRLLLKDDPTLVVYGRGFKGKGNLLNDGARELKGLREIGCGKVVICLDADKEDPDELRERVEAEIVRPAGIAADCCIAVPVRAIEAWIMADIGGALRLWKPHAGWSPGEIKNPELLDNPKSELVRLSRQGRVRPRYDPPIHNPLIAAHLNTDRVAAKCPSFRHLRDFVQAGVA